MKEKILLKLEEKKKILIGTELFFDFERCKEEWAELLAYIYREKSTNTGEIDLGEMIVNNDFLRKYIEKKGIKRKATLAMYFPEQTYFKSLIQAFYNIDISKEVNPQKWNSYGRRMWYTWYGWNDGENYYGIERLLSMLATELAS